MGKLFPAFLLKKRDDFYLATAGFRLRLLADPQLLLLHSRQICNGSCTRTPAFAEATAVKARNSSQLISCTVTVFWLKYHPDYSGCPVLPPTLRSGQDRVTRSFGRLAPSLKQPTGLFLYAQPFILPGRYGQWRSAIG